MTNIKLLTASLELIENEFFNTLTVSAVIWKNDENYNIQAISKNISKILGFSQENFISKKSLYWRFDLNNWEWLIWKTGIKKFNSAAKANLRSLSFAYITPAEVR